MKTIYADNNATTRIAPEVYEAMGPFFTAEYFNPSSMYEAARPAANAVAEARQSIATHLGVGDPGQILNHLGVKREVYQQFLHTPAPTPAYLERIGNAHKVRLIRAHFVDHVFDSGKIIGFQPGHHVKPHEILRDFNGAIHGHRLTMLAEKIDCAVFVPAAIAANLFYPYRKVSASSI